MFYQNKFSARELLLEQIQKKPIGGISKKDFIAKLSIAYKEARETKYWLRILKDTGYISENEFQKYFIDVEEVLKILYAIINSSRNNL
jgi:four helix bundle protein